MDAAPPTLGQVALVNCLTFPLDCGGYGRLGDPEISRGHDGPQRVLHTVAADLIEAI